MALSVFFSLAVVTNPKVNEFGIMACGALANFPAPTLQSSDYETCEQGGKLVLSLTVENVANIFRKVKQKTTFYRMYRNSIPPEKQVEPTTAAVWWLQHSTDRRWRRIIYNLDQTGETDIADELIPFAESPIDLSMTVNQVTPVFMAVSNWQILRGAFPFVPDARAEIILKRFPYDGDQRREAATYYVAVTPWAEWSDLAGDLYRAGETAAIAIFRVQLPILKDPTLILEKVLMAMSEVEIWGSMESYIFFNMLNTVHNDIIARLGNGPEAKEAIVREYIINHPYPRWEQVISLIHALEEWSKAKKGVAQMVQDKYLTMSDKKAEAIVKQALESGSFKQRNVIAVIVGLMGSGKTWLLSRLFGIEPPDCYSSTGVANPSVRGLLHHIANLAFGSWELLPEQSVLGLFAPLLSAGIYNTKPALLDAPFAESGNMPNLENMGSTTVISVSQPPLPHSSGNVAQAIFRPGPERSYASKTLVELVCDTKGSKRSFVVELLHMIDTGGQSEFMEVLPCVIHHSNPTVLVLNLAQPLDARPHLDFHENGKVYKCPLTSLHTKRQMINQLVCSVNAKQYLDPSGKCSKMIVVGTHRDCVQGDLNTILVALNKELKKILLPRLKRELILYRSPDQIVFPVNSKEPDETDDTVFSNLRKSIGDVGIDEEYEVPLSFCMFEEDALKYAKKLGRNILTFKECLQVGYMLRMSTEVVKAALIYFHKHNVFLYFQKALPDLVFVDPQVPLTFINAIVAFSYKERSGAFYGFPAEYSHLLKKGIITEGVLSHESLSSCFITGLYNPCHALQLFSHLYTVAPLTENRTNVEIQKSLPTDYRKQSSKKQEYLMMTLLPFYCDKCIEYHLPTSSQVAPLVISFENDCVPSGCFSNVVSCVISQYKWKICSVDQCTPECMARNAVMLSDPELPVKIFFVNVSRHLEVHIHSDKVMKKHLGVICSRVCKTILASLDKVFEVLKFKDICMKPAFLCPCDPSIESHAARVSCDSYLVCTITDSNMGTLQREHHFWFHGQGQKREEEPSLQQLIQFETASGTINVLERIGVHCTELGILLLEDSDGSVTETIEKQYKNPNDITHKILQRWIQGKGKRPVNWTTLIDALEGIKLSELANQIEKNTM